MTQAVLRILQEVEQLSAAERADLADRIAESLVDEIPDAIATAHLAEVRRRIAQAESGQVALVPAAEALLCVRQLVASARAAG